MADDPDPSDDHSDDHINDHMAANRKLQELFGVPKHLEIEDPYVQQVASIGLNTGKLTREQIVELCGAVMGHLARRNRD